MEVAVMGQGKSIRLDRFLAEMKQGTRSQVKEMIRKGRVLVDGTVCRESDRKIFPDETRVTLDGQPVGWADTEYYMLNKPQGVVSATEDGRYQTVIDLIDEAKRKDLFPVGRLDIDTEGLLLITNDGALAHELLAPKKHVDKVYFARVKGTLKEGIEARFQAGLTLTDGTPVRPAELVIEKKWNDAGEDLCEARLTIHEGKFHQVKRMAEAVGRKVEYLKRISMGPLVLDKELKKGNVYNKFQPGTNLLITNYPNSGGAEMRSWCHETVAADWQKFRSSENYNKLAYNTEFPWMADGDNGEVSMNYATKNRDNRWEVLRLYTFRSFDDDVYRRDAVLETDTTVRYQLADISLPDGILRIDKVSTGSPTQVRLGNYSLPQLDGDIKEMTRTLDKGYTASIIDNGDYQLATVALEGWKNGVKVQRPKGLHPVSSTCAVPVTEADVNDSDIFVTLHLWKKSDNAFTDKELRPVKSVKISKDRKQVTVKLADGRTKTVNFN